jgi:hypothetical protein
VPKLTYVSHKVEVTIDDPDLGNKSLKVEIKLDFVDGDGDLIVPVYSDTVSYSKLFINSYKKVNGLYQLLIPNDSGYSFPESLPYEDFMSREGQNKTFKGTITKTFNYYFTKLANIDTIKYEFYLFDRAYHKSNIVEISDIPLK